MFRTVLASQCLTVAWIFPYAIFVSSFLLGSPREFIWHTLMGQYGTEEDFTIDVPSGQSLLKVEICCGTGDADLWVRYGEAQLYIISNNDRFYDSAIKKNMTASPIQSKMCSHFFV